MFSEYLSLIRIGWSKQMSTLSEADTCLVNICHLYVLDDLTSLVDCQWPTHVWWIYLSLICVGRSNLMSTLPVPDTCLVNILSLIWVVSGCHMFSEYLSLIWVVSGRHMFSEYLSIIWVGRSNLIGILWVADTCLVNICHLYVLGDINSWVYCQWPTHVWWTAVTYMWLAILPNEYIVSSRHMSSEYLSLIYMCVGRSNLMSILSVADTC